MCSLKIETISCWSSLGQWLKRVKSLWCWYYSHECDSHQCFAIAYSLRFLQLVQLLCLSLAVGVNFFFINLCCYNANCAYISSSIMWKVQGSWEKAYKQQVVGMSFRHSENLFNNFRPLVPMILKWICCLSQLKDRGTCIVRKMLFWRGELSPLPI